MPAKPLVGLGRRRGRAIMRDPHLPLTALAPHLAELAIAVKRLWRSSQPVEIGPPLSWARIEDRVEMRRIAPLGAVTGVVEILHRQHHVTGLVDDGEIEPRDGHRPLQHVEARHHSARLDPTDGGGGQPGLAGHPALAEMSDAARPAKETSRRKRAGQHIGDLGPVIVT